MKEMDESVRGVMMLEFRIFQVIFSLRLRQPRPDRLVTRAASQASDRGLVARCGFPRRGAAAGCRRGRAGGRWGAWGDMMGEMVGEMEKIVEYSLRIEVCAQWGCDCCWGSENLQLILHRRRVGAWAAREWLCVMLRWFVCDAFAAV